MNRLEVRPARWVPNDVHIACQLCKAYFNLFRRKHHCRSCGKLICYGCSSNNEYVSGYGDTRVRVCEACYREIRRIKKLKTRKWSIISSYFNTNY